MNTLVLSTEQVSCEMLAMTVIWFNSCNYSGDSGFPCVSDGKDCLQGKKPELDPWVGKIPWRRERLSTPVFWPRKFYGLYSSWGRKEWDTTERLSLYSLRRLRRRRKQKQITKADLSNLGSVLWSTTATALPAKRGPVFLSRACFPVSILLSEMQAKTLPVIELAQCFKRSLQYSLESRKTASGVGWGQRITNEYRQHQLASLISSNSLMACSYSGGSAFSSDSKTSQKAWWTMCLTRPAKLWEWNESLFFT